MKNTTLILLTLSTLLYYCEQIETLSIDDPGISELIDSGDTINNQEDVTLVTNTVSGQYSYSFYLSLYEIPWYNKNEQIYTSANIAISSLSGSILADYVSHGIQYYSFRTEDDSLTIQVTKPGYKSHKLTILATAINAYNQDNPLTIKLNHQTTFHPQTNLVGLSYDYNEKNVRFIEVDFYGNEHELATHDYDALGSIGDIKSDNKYNYLGIRTNENLLTYYHASVNPFDGSSTETQILQGFSNATMAYAESKSQYYALFHTPYINFDLTYIRPDGSYEVIRSFDEYVGMIGGWCAFDQEEEIYWFGAHNNRGNYLLGYDVNQDTVVAKIQTSLFDLTNLAHHKEENKFVGLSRNLDNDLTFISMDLTGNEQVITTFDLGMYAVGGWSLLDEKNSHFYFARPVFSARQGNKTEIIIADINNGQILHSFQLKKAIVNSIQIRENNYLL